MGGTYSTDGEMENVYRILSGKFDGTWSRGWPGLEWKDNIKLGLKDIVCGSGLDASGSEYVGEDSCENRNEPSGSIKGREFPYQFIAQQFMKKDFASWSWLCCN
jgi:hypothetical protein